MMNKMTNQSDNIEKMATISLDITNLKEKMESVKSDVAEQHDVLDSLSKNLEANAEILKKNLASFEERIKKLG